MQLARSSKVRLAWTGAAAAVLAVVGMTAYAVADTASTPGTAQGSCGPVDPTTSTAPCDGSWHVDVPVSIPPTPPTPPTPPAPDPVTVTPDPVTVTATVTQTTTRDPSLNPGDTLSVTCNGTTLSVGRPNATQADASCTSTTAPPPPPPPAQTLNCLPNPHLCGFPDATNTGYGATQLTAYTGPLNITTAGTVIDGKSIHGPLQISASNVTIQNSLVWLDGSNVSGQNVALWIRSGTGAKVSHVEVDGARGSQSYCISAIANDGTGAAFDHVDAHGCGDGFRGGDFTMTDSYEHGFWFGQINGKNVDTPHADCWQGLNGDSNVTLTHNTCNNPNSAPPPGSPGYSNAVLQLGTEGGHPASNWLFQGNLAQGGGLSINMRQTPITGIVVKGNQWGRDNAYGLIGSNTGNSFTWGSSGADTNIWDDNGAFAPGTPG